MAEVKISALPSGTVTATDIFPGVQSSTTKKFTVADALALAWPVGSVFIAVVSTNPATLLGYGTWSAFGAGQMLVGLDAGQTEFDTVEETGGAKTVTLTATEMPAHTHNQQRHGTATGGLTGITTAPDTSSSVPTAMGPATASAGSGGAHANLPPYIVVYMWKRTA